MQPCALGEFVVGGDDIGGLGDEWDVVSFPTSPVLSTSTSSSEWSVLGREEDFGCEVGGVEGDMR